MPDFPGRGAAFPEGFQLFFVPQGVHGFPESVMLEGDQIARGGQVFKRPAFPYGVVPVDEVENTRFQNEKTAVDPSAVALRLFLKRGNAVVFVQVERSEPAGGLHGRDGGQFDVGSVKIDEPVHGDTAQAVAIGEHERFVVHIGLDPLHPAAGHGVLPGIDQGHLPWFRAPVVDDAVAAVGEIEGDAAVVKKVVGEVFLDHIALVPEADDEIVETEMGEDCHDVPQDRPPADFEHRFRFDFRFFAQPGTESAGEGDDFHLFGHTWHGGFCFAVIVCGSL